MAIAFVKDFYSEAANPTVPAGGFAQGNLLVLGSGWDDGTNTITSITDTRSNSWAVCTGTAINDATNTRSGAMWYSLLTTALQSGDTITISMTGNSGAVIIGEWSGIASSPFDKGASSSDNNATTSHTTGNTATTTQADELLVGVHYSLTTTAWTATGGYSVNENQSPFSIYRMVMQNQVVSATGAYASTGTTSAAGFTNMIATFKASGAAAGDPRISLPAAARISYVG